MRITAKIALEHAEICAAFLRQLTHNGIDLATATTLTGQYLLAVVMRIDPPQPPAEPWRE